MHRGRGLGNGFSSFHPRLEIPAIESFHRFLDLGRFWTPDEFLNAMQTCDDELRAFDVERAKAEEEKRKTND